MAFKINALSVLAYSRGFTLWHYRSRTDTIEDILGQGYFEIYPCAEILRRDDVLYINGSNGTKQVVVKETDVEHVELCAMM